MINYRYDFELHTLHEIHINDARLFLDIIVNNALLKAQAILYKVLCARYTRPLKKELRQAY